MTHKLFTRGRFLPLSAAVAFCCSLAVAFFWLAESKAVAAARPNVVMVQVDDMARSLMDAEYKDNGRWVAAMPNLRRQIAAQGVEFSRYYVSDPICGPSRASLLTGRSAHNHGMTINVPPYGYPLWQNSEISRENLPVWLDRAGYRTIHVGKYTNQYGANPPDEVPAGWDRWVSPTMGTWSYYGNPLNINGVVTPKIGSWQARDSADCVVATLDVPGACTHATDLQTAYAVDELAKTSTDLNPFYLQLDYNAPHDDGRKPAGPTPPTRVLNIAKRTPPPENLTKRPASRSQPLFIRRQPVMSGEVRREVRDRWRNEVASLKAIDQGIGRVLEQLRVNGQLENTYVMFTSDNGLFHGEHRIAYGKFLPHEPSSHVPLVMRGPGLPKGSKSGALGSNLDIASTVLAMTGVGAGSWQDGRSLLGFARNPRRLHKSPVLLEGYNGRGRDEPERFLDGSGQSRVNQAVVLNYTGFVAKNWKYIGYSYGEEELYDLAVDPGEMRNLVKFPRYANVLRWARSQARRLGTCVASECRAPVKAPRAKLPK